jgi:hypothetical protein
MGVLLEDGAIVPVALLAGAAGVVLEAHPRNRGDPRPQQPALTLGGRADWDPAGAPTWPGGERRVR